LVIIPFATGRMVRPGASGRSGHLLTSDAGRQDLRPDQLSATGIVGRLAASSEVTRSDRACAGISGRW
jgi:hypothetical protein